VDTKAALLCTSNSWLVNLYHPDRRSSTRTATAELPAAPPADLPERDLAVRRRLPEPEPGGAKERPGRIGSGEIRLRLLLDHVDHHVSER